MKNSELHAVIAKSLAAFGKKLALCCAIILTFTLAQKYILRNTTYEYTAAKSPAGTSVQSNASHRSTLCTLRLEGEKLKVYSNDGIPEYAAKIDTALLTDYDRKLLSEGICASYEELSELIGELIS